MRTIHCSDYLYRQEVAHFAAAMNLVKRADTPTPFWRRLFRALFGISTPRWRAETRKRRRALADARFMTIEGEYWARGRAGEDHLAGVLAEHLDDRYLLLRNYTPPRPNSAGGDIDAVLLGPHGVTVFEVKAWRGDFRFESGDWWYQSSSTSKWEPAQSSPSQQAKANARRIRAILERSRLLDVRIQPVVAVAHPDMRVEIAPPVDVYVFFAMDDSPRVTELVKPPRGAEPLPFDRLQHICQSLLWGLPTGVSS